MLTPWACWITYACATDFSFGSTSDLKEQLEHIQNLFPKSDLYAVGSSAGTGLLVRYLGEQGTDTPFKAAFAMCPGYNTEIGFKNVHPFYSKMMTKSYSSILFILIKIHGTNFLLLKSSGDHKSGRV